MINFGQGPVPQIDDVRDLQPESAGGVIEPGDTEAPSLTPKQIAEFSDQFLADTRSYYYNTWLECVNLISDFRRMGTGVVAKAGGNTGAMQFLRPRFVNVNIVQPLYRNVVARLSVEQPSCVVIPASPSTEDIVQAQAAEQALKYFWRAAEVKKHLTEMIEWMALLGTGALFTEVVNGRTEGDVFTGDVKVRAISPDRIRAEPGVGNPDDSRFLGITILTTKDALKRQFPDKAAIIDQAPVPTMPFGPSTSQFGAKAAPDRVEVLQAYCRSGHWFTLCGAEVLAQGRVAGNRMPLQIARYTKIPGQFFGMGMVEPNISIQFLFSDIINQIAQNARMMGNPKIMVEQNSKVANDAFTSRVGEIIKYSGQAPTVWTPPPLANYIQQMPAMLQSYSHDVTGIHTTTSGKRAVGISSGRAIEALTSNDLAQLQSTQDAITYAVEGMSTTALAFIKAYYPEEKVMRAFDQYGRGIFKAISKTDLGDTPEVFVEADTLFSATVKDRDQKTLDLLRLGMVDAPTAKKMLSYHLDPMAPLEEVADMQHAQTVLMTVADDGYWLLDPATGQPQIDALTGQPKARVVIYPTDNLDVFERVIRDFMRTDAFRSMDKEAADGVDALYQEVIKMIAAKMAPPEAKEMNSNGNPKGMGEPGAPPLPQALPGNMDTTAAADAAVEAAEADTGLA